MLSKLKEYKEFVAILVFFLGGFFWIDSEFPKKSDVTSVRDGLSNQVTTLECMLKQYMRLTQLQLGAQQTEKRIRELRDQWLERQDSTAGLQPAELSPAMRHELNELKEQLDAERSLLNEISGEIREVNEDLKLQTCGTVTS